VILAYISAEEPPLSKMLPLPRMVQIAMRGTTIPVNEDFAKNSISPFSIFTINALGLELNKLIWKEQIRFYAFMMLVTFMKLSCNRE